MSNNNHPVINWRSRIVKSGKIKASEITPHPNNPRRHPQFQRDAVAASFNELGQIAPILVNINNNYLIDGEERSWLALSQSDDVELDVIYVDLTEEEHLKALTYLDATSALATYDAGQLDALLQEVNSDNPAIQQMLSELAEGAGLYLEQPAPAEDPGAQIDRAEELQAKWQVERGQLWVIPSKSGKGEHRLLCGDSTNADDVARVMGGEKATGVFTSPPYAEQRKNQYGGIPEDEYVEWWGAIQASVRSIIAEDASFFVNIKPNCEDAERVLYVFDLVLAMKRRWGWAYIDEYCWLRAGVPKMVKYRFKNQFEPVYQFAVNARKFKFRPKSVMHYSSDIPKAGGAGVGNTNWAGKQGTTASDALGVTGKIFGTDEIVEGDAYPGNVLKAWTNREALGHSAAFPPELPEFFMLAYSDSGDIWFDPFMGSGTVIVAAEQNQRIGRGIELLPGHCGIILERMAGMGLTPKQEKAPNGA